MTDEQLIEMHLVTLWEEAKGKLRAMVGAAAFKGGTQWNKLERAVNGFVKVVEDDGLHR